MYPTWNILYPFTICVIEKYVIQAPLAKVQFGQRATFGISGAQKARVVFVTSQEVIVAPQQPTCESHSSDLTWTPSKT